MELNLKKCKEMLIDLRRNKTAIPLTNIENNTIERVTSYKLLGRGLMIKGNGIRTPIRTR